VISNIVGTTLAITKIAHVISTAESFSADRLISLEEGAIIILLA